MNLKVCTADMFQQGSDVLKLCQLGFPATVAYKFYEIPVSEYFAVYGAVFVFQFIDYMGFKQDINTIIYSRPAYMYFRKKFLMLTEDFFNGNLVFHIINGSQHGFPLLSFSQPLCFNKMKQGL
nr:hypothetical protein [Bacteroides sp. OF04-15BH]